MASTKEEYAQLPAGVRMQWAGAIGLLCRVSENITDEEETDAIARCVRDWCRVSGYTMERSGNRISVEPDAGEDESNADTD